MDNEKLQKAERLYRKGDLEQALLLYQELLHDNYRDPHLWHVAGGLSAQLGDNESALNYIEQALKLNAKEASFYISKANVLIRLNKIKEAITTLQTAIKLRPNYPAAYSNLGNCYYRLDNLEAARKAYHRALELQPGFADAEYNVALLLTRLGEQTEAVERFKKLIEQHPKYGKAYSQLTQLYLNAEQYDDVITLTERRFSVCGQDADSYHDLGIALFKQDKTDEAISAFEQALILNTDYADTNHLLGNANIALGDYNKATNYFFRQLEVEPMVESYYNIGVIFMHQERNKEAIRYLDLAADMDPDYLPTHLNLGAIYLKQNRTAQAISHYRKAVEIKPDDAQIKHILAALEQDKTPDAAPKEYLQNLFDQYSTYYDQHLTQHLKYDVPQKFLQAFIEETDADKNSLTILDLGCGTGLVGAQFKRYAEKLIGVDLSEQMIDSARTKKLYDELDLADVQTTIDQYSNLDLIIAGDVFTYIGKLDRIFKDAFGALKNDGLFIFSVEKTNTQPYELHQSIRYAHSRHYLEQLIEDTGFEVLRFDNLVLRQQRKVPVEGYLIILQKK